MALKDDLLKRAKQNDDDALRMLYDEYAPLIYAYIYRRIGDAMLAEDLTGRVFVRVLSAIQRDRAWHTSFRAWLYRIAHNVVVDHCRGQPDEPVLQLDENYPAFGNNPAAELWEKLSQERLLAAVQELTADQQQVVVLRFGEGLTAREVAEVMDKSVSAVEALQYRGLASLRRRLVESEEG